MLQLHCMLCDINYTVFINLFLSLFLCLSHTLFHLSLSPIQHYTTPYFIVIFILSSSCIPFKDDSKKNIGGVA